MFKMSRTSIHKAESLRFYKYLCQKIGSEEVVKIRRLVFLICDIGKRYESITSGSKGEGLNMTSSDLDLIMIDNYFKVFESETEVEGRNVPLIIHTEESQPCFTQLCLLNPLKYIHYNAFMRYPELLQNNYLSYVFSSKQYKLMFLPEAISCVGSTEIHGPCISYLNDKLDFAVCLKFDKWIFQARQLVSRQHETKYPNCSGNKHNYYRYKQDISHLVIGLHSNAVSGLLKLASFFYVHKNYVASLSVITYTLQKCTDETIYITFFKDIRTFNHIQNHVLKLMKIEKFHTIIKSLTINPCEFEVDSSIFPQELELDVTRTPTLVHALPFAHFLSFLCRYKLHDNLSCRQSLQQLKHVSCTLSNYGTIVYVPQSLNTIIFCGIAHQLLGDIYVAKRAFQTAADLDKNNFTSAASRLSSLI
ncbi:unnamed protein product [Mytilus coruscus]|uniref:Mab-21-like HhH/H2TH-like domain-containing protein n=1 Tax=Mytilus coruscus TaxID=42192 RepID=A0A6J8AQG3_MYTCO|nr:unnamed protein product [Mytilus coruscus]